MIMSLTESQVRRIVREEIMKFVGSLIPEVSDREQREIERMFGEQPEKTKIAKKGLEWIGK